MSTLYENRQSANLEVIGSKADVPKDLIEQMRELEKQFTVPTDLLKKITGHFISELAKGMFLVV